MPKTSRPCCIPSSGSPSLIAEVREALRRIGGEKECGLIEDPQSGGYVFLSEGVKPLRDKRNTYVPTSGECARIRNEILRTIFEPQPSARLEGVKEVKASVKVRRSPIVGDHEDIDIRLEFVEPGSWEKRRKDLLSVDQHADRAQELGRLAGAPGRTGRRSASRDRALRAGRLRPQPRARGGPRRRAVPPGRAPAGRDHARAGGQDPGEVLARRHAVLPGQALPGSRGGQDDRGRSARRFSARPRRTSSRTSISSRSIRRRTPPLVSWASSASTGSPRRSIRSAWSRRRAAPCEWTSTTRPWRRCCAPSGRRRTSPAPAGCRATSSRTSSPRLPTDGRRTPSATSSAGSWLPARSSCTPPAGWSRPRGPSPLRR